MTDELERALAIQGMQENSILAITSKYGNSAPGGRPRENDFFSEIFNFYGKVSEFRF